MAVKKKAAKKKRAVKRVRKPAPELIGGDETPFVGDGPWTLRQQMFVLEFMVDYSPMNAAIRAGFAEHTAANSGYKLKQMPHIKAKIQELVKERVERLQRTSDQVINQMGNIAFADLRELSPELLGGLSDSTAAAIQSVKLTKRQSGEYDPDGNLIWDDVVEYRIADRNAALNMLGKVHKLLTDKVDHSGAVEITHKTKIVEIPAKSPLPDDDGNPVVDDDANSEE